MRIGVGYEIGDAELENCLKSLDLGIYLPPDFSGMVSSYAELILTTSMRRRPTSADGA